MKGSLQAGELSQNEGLFIFACQCAFTEKRLISSRFKAIYILYQDWAEQAEGIDDMLTQIGEV
jgi:hypothetical protein